MADPGTIVRAHQKVKHYRRVATRKEKTARNFLAFIQVASIIGAIAVAQIPKVAQVLSTQPK